MPEEPPRLRKEPSGQRVDWDPYSAEASDSQTDADLPKHRQGTLLLLLVRFWYDPAIHP
jgi:hypothetical protein